MKEWYLMKSGAVSGFESDDFNDSAGDTFDEALLSAMGADVEICNYDLSIRRKLRVIIQGRVQDTKLNSLQRRILCKIGTCKAGEYLYYDGRYWLIIGLVDNNGIYEKGVVILCNYYLSWINHSGKIVQRWVSISSASQYNNGETTTDNYQLKTDQLMVLTPNDDESLIIDHRQRFVIDKRCEVYEKSLSDPTVNDTSFDLTTYMMTRIDTVLFNYVDSGHSEFMAYEIEQHESDGYYYIDGKGYWLCEKPEEKESPVYSRIDYDNNIIYNGLEPCTFKAVFYDEQGHTVDDVTPQWQIVSDFSDKLISTYSGNDINISTNHSDLNNKSFILSLSAEGYETVSVNVTIRSFM